MKEITEEDSKFFSTNIIVKNVQLLVVGNVQFFRSATKNSWLPERFLHFQKPASKRMILVPLTVPIYYH
jgi:hypothetical protein